MKNLAFGWQSLWDVVLSPGSQLDAAGLNYVPYATGNRDTIVASLETPPSLLLSLPANPGELRENTEKGIYCPPFPIPLLPLHHTCINGQIFL